MSETMDCLASDDVMDRKRMIAEHLNDLLASWHAWSSGHSFVHGYPTVCSTCRSSRASRQYDDANGGLDAQIDAVLMEAVDSVVYAISDPWRTALAIQARNLVTGVRVWNSPRLPSCEVKRRELLVVAREKLAAGLAGAGLL
jgi:hypothetical protein